MDCKLLILENEAAILDVLLDMAENTKYGLITNWNEPYGISFKELRRNVDIIKYGEEYVRKIEYDECLKRLNMN